MSDKKQRTKDRYIEEIEKVIGECASWRGPGFDSMLLGGLKACALAQARAILKGDEYLPPDLDQIAKWQLSERSVLALCWYDTPQYKYPDQIGLTQEDSNEIFDCLWTYLRKHYDRNQFLLDAVQRLQDDGMPGGCSVSGSDISAIARQVVPNYR